MKHTFAGGITATSNDGLGDEFLAGMTRQCDLEDGPTEIEKLRQRVRDLEAGERRAALLVTALVQKAGGAVQVSDLDEMLAYDFVVYRDESQRGTVLKVRPKK